jgi:hypothetical protein
LAALIGIFSLEHFDLGYAFAIYAGIDDDIRCPNIVHMPKIEESNGPNYGGKVKVSTKPGEDQLERPRSVG